MTMNQYQIIKTVIITNDRYLSDRFYSHFSNHLHIRTLSYTNSALDCLVQIQWQDIELLIIDVSPLDQQIPKLIKRIKTLNHTIKYIALVDDEEKFLQCQLINSGLDAVVLKSQMMRLLPPVITVVRSHYACLPNNGNIRTRKVAVNTLTNREKEVFTLMQDQMSNDEIAQILGISAKTVSVHRFHISTKLKKEAKFKSIEPPKKLSFEII